MERRLIVMRHAQARSGDVDHERRLTDHGQKDARRIADRLVEIGWIPARVLCSDAARTVETWSRMVDRIPGPIELLTTSRLYGAAFDAFSAVAGEQPDAVRSLLAIGHNPGWEEVVAVLSSEQVSLGTAHAALLIARRDAGPRWHDALEPDSWRLADVLTPKEHHG